MEIVTNFLVQVLLSIGIIVIFGLLIAFCRRGFCAIVGYNGPKILLATGIVGTPIHELSHALFCLIFGHKVVEMKLYLPNAPNGTLGYVNHSFNPRNLYHQIGNFFIGIAPILGGSGVLLLLMMWLTPETFASVSDTLSAMPAFAGFDSILVYLGALWEMITLIFSPENFGMWQWWVFIVLALMIASHMELSGADIKGGIKGLLLLLLLILIMDVILYFVAIDALPAVTFAMSTFGLYVAGFLLISAVFSLTLIVLALIFRGVAMLFGR